MYERQEEPDVASMLPVYLETASARVFRATRLA
jgi:hypothetical protein